MALLLYKTSKPKFTTGATVTDKIVISPKQGVYFPAHEEFEDELEKQITALSECKTVELDLGHIYEIDSGFADAVKHTKVHLERCNFTVSIVNANVRRSC